MKNLKIKNIELDGNVLLAPMAGFTNVAFREQARSFGASLCYTEMISAKALVFGNQKTFDLLETFECETPCAVQLFGSDPETMAKAVKIDALQKFDIIDLNMGCPAPKIFQNGDGSALLKDLNKARKIIEAVVAATEKPVTVKFRIGINSSNIVAEKFAKMCEEAGASAICIHGRTTEQGYSGKSDLNVIAACKKVVKIPVIANGDCNSKDDFEHILKVTKADAVMVGRGALGRPEIFAEIRDLKINKTKKEITLEYLELMKKYFGEKRALLESRAHLMFFIKGYKNSTKLKLEILNAKSLDEVKCIISRFFE